MKTNKYLKKLNKFVNDRDRILYKDGYNEGKWKGKMEIIKQIQGWTEGKQYDFGFRQKLLNLLSELENSLYKNRKKR